MTSQKSQLVERYSGPCERSLLRCVSPKLAHSDHLLRLHNSVSCWGFNCRGCEAPGTAKDDQWARIVSTFDPLEPADKLVAWRERMLDAHGSLARNAATRASLQT
jgi:hypothetical protein